MFASEGARTQHLDWSHCPITPGSSPAWKLSRNGVLGSEGLGYGRIVGDSETILMSCSPFGHSAACPKTLRVLGLQRTESARREFRQSRAQKQMFVGGLGGLSSRTST